MDIDKSSRDRSQLLGDGIQGNAVEAAVLDAAQAVEHTLDVEIDELKSLQHDDLEVLRRRRIAEMKKKAEEEALWRRMGHGRLCNIPEKDIFERGKHVSRCVFMLTRSGPNYHARDFEEHISKIAERHLETFFGVLNAEKSPFLCDRFHLELMPSIILFKNMQVCKVLHGLDFFSKKGKFDTSYIELQLFQLGLLTNTGIGDNM